MKFKNQEYVDIKKRQTKKLGLNIVPIRINRRDAVKIIRVLWDALILLEKERTDQCPVSMSQVFFEGKRTKFCELIKELENRVKEQGEI